MTTLLIHDSGPDKRFGMSENSALPGGRPPVPPDSAPDGKNRHRIGRADAQGDNDSPVARKGAKRLTWIPVVASLLTFLIGISDVLAVFESPTVHARLHKVNAVVPGTLTIATHTSSVIVGLLLARAFGWLWMDPLAGIAGACVIASWSFGLIRDTGAILLDMNPDRRMADNLRQTIEGNGDRISDLHLWRLGPGHLGAIVCVATQQARDADYYRTKLARFRSLSHLTIEVRSA